MTTTRSPRRTCIGCRAVRPQAALVRVASTPDGRLVVDRTAPGRGAWLCKSGAACLETARKRRGFERALRRPVDAAALDALSGELARSATNPGDEQMSDEQATGCGGSRGEG